MAPLLAPLFIYLSLSTSLYLPLFTFFLLSPFHNRRGAQGDNPTMSLDSRDYGPVPLGLVRGRAVYQLWPAFRAIERSSIFGGSGGSSPGRSHH